MRIKTVNHKGHPVSYHIADLVSTTALVFIHGAGGDSKLFHYQLAAFGKERKIIAPDLPGHGRSQCDYLPSLEDYAAAIEEICGKEGITDIIPVGHSMGGPVALELFRRGKISIRGFVFISTGAVLPVSPVVFDLIERDFNSFCEFLVRFTYGKSTPDQIKNLSLKELRSTGRNVIENDFRICSRADGRNLLPSIKVPVLVMVNKDDKMVPPGTAGELNEGIAGSRMIVLPGDGHVPQLDNHEHVNSIIREFLQDLA